MVRLKLAELKRIEIGISCADIPEHLRKLTLGNYLNGRLRSRGMTGLSCYGYFVAHGANFI
jgi:hypothetical protein